MLHFSWNFECAKEEKRKCLVQDILVMVSLGWGVRGEVGQTS